MKRIISLIVSIAIILSTTCLNAVAQETLQTEEETIEVTEEIVIPEEKPATIKITNKNKIVQKNSSVYKITYEISGESPEQKIVFTSNDKRVATVNSSGIVTAKKCGKTIITATLTNGNSASIQITVTDNSLPLNENSTQLSLDYDNVTKIKYGTSYQKRNLEGFIITDNKTKIKEKCKIKVNGKVNVRNGAGTSYKAIATLKNGVTVTLVEKEVKSSNGYVWDKITFNKNQTGYVATDYLEFVEDNVKTIFMSFAVHGFEDEYYRDGKVLVNEANALIDYFSKHPQELKASRLVVVPCANPDGMLAGKNNKRSGSTAFGRCTANHIDINRDFGVFKAVETRKLRDFIKSCNPDIYLDVHGWLNETIGNSKLNSIISSNLGLAKKINHYPTQEGYAIDWVHKQLKIPSALIEYKSSSDISTANDVTMIRKIINFNNAFDDNTSSSQVNFSSPVVWKNGKTAEPVYKLSSFNERFDTIKAKTNAKCFGKSVSSYIVVYSSGNKHKTGFVKYSGNVDKVPSISKAYKNGKTSQAVYSSTGKGKNNIIGYLDPNEKCKCYGIVDGMYLVVYLVNGTNNYKCGFVSYNGVMK